eukprot:scaffold5715_cov33-Tisochrysis_lutea.AAC.1
MAHLRPGLVLLRKTPQETHTFCRTCFRPVSRCCPSGLHRPVDIFCAGHVNLVDGQFSRWVNHGEGRARLCGLHPRSIDVKAIRQRP